MKKEERRKRNNDLLRDKKIINTFCAISINSKGSKIGKGSRQTINTTNA